MCSARIGLVAVAVIVASASTLAAQGNDAAPPSEADLVGVWETAYSPGLPGVSEVDSNVLVLLPGGQYFELATPVGAEGRMIVEKGDYAVDGSVVRFRAASRRSVSESPLAEAGQCFDTHAYYFLPQRDVVLGESWREKKITRTDVLARSAEPENLNYTWGRYYPSWPVDD